jgi:hypothetical protein
MSGSLKGRIHPGRALFEFLPRRQILAVDRWSVGENPGNRLQVVEMIGGKRGCLFHFGVFSIQLRHIFLSTIATPEWRR